jgi:two-component sensor histidine kinase
VILHELATNATKYGALSGTEGHTEVIWSVGPDGRLVLRWTEEGGPPASAPSHIGLGTRMIQRMVKDQLNGDLSRAWSSEGLACEITFPI